MVHTKIYVIECKTPRFWYVGSTFRELFDRIDEHENKYGSLWTRRHGFKRMVMWADVPSYACSILEDELTEWLMHQYGVHNVRGGNYVNCRPTVMPATGGCPRASGGAPRHPTLVSHPLLTYRLCISALCPSSLWSLDASSILLRCSVVLSTLII